MRARRGRLERGPADDGAARRRRARARVAPGGPGREGDAAARRPARLPELARARSRGTARSTSASRWTTCPPRPPTRAPAGRPRGPWIEAACQTAADDSLAPPGRHVLSMFCQCFPVDVDADAAADAAIARFAEVCPELPDRIVDRLVLGPRELEERFGLAGGHIFHGEMLPGQLLEDRYGPERFEGIDGLYLAGSGAHPGGAVTGRARIPRGARRCWPTVARCFVTRELPGTALDRLRAEHEVDVWPGELPPSRDGADRARARRRGAPLPPDRRDRRGRDRRVPAAARDLELRGRLGQHRLRGRGRARDRGGRHARRPDRHDRRPGVRADAGRGAPAARGRARGARGRSGARGSRAAGSARTCTARRCASSGMGRIGSAVARRAEGFGMQVVDRRSRRFAAPMRSPRPTSSRSTAR